MIYRVKMLWKSHDYFLLMAIVAVGIVFRVAAIAGFNHSPQSDELAYQSMALNLISGNGIIDNMGNYAMYNVGYPLLVLSPAFIIFGEHLLVAKLANLILGVVSIFLCYLTAKEAGAGRLGRLLAAAAWAIYLPASVYGVYLAKENLMTPLMLGVIWCALRLTKDPTWKISVICGVLFGLLALTGSAALALVFLVLLALILCKISFSQRLGLGMLILLVAMVVTTPWLARNWRVIGAPVLNTNGGFNLYLGNNPAATGWFVSIADTPRGPTWNELRLSGEVQASEILKQEAVSWIKEHPSEFLLLAFKKAVYLWMPPFHEGKGQGSTAETVIRIMWLTQFLILVAVAIASLVLLPLKNSQLAILWLAIASYTMLHMLFYIIFRYREPIMPVVVIIAGLAVEFFITARTQNLKKIKSNLNKNVMYQRQ